MKNIFLIVMVCFLMSSFMIVSGQLYGPGTGIENPELKAAGQGTGQGLDGNVTLLRQRAVVRSGNYVNSMGQRMNIQARENNMCRFEVNGVVADCPFNLTQEEFQNRTRLYAGLSNGRNVEIKVMPDVASQTALQRLRLRNCDGNCSIELREVGRGNQSRMVYETRTQRNSKVFGLFGARMNVRAQVDAETGELVSSNKPWWAFLASEPEE